MIRLVVLVALLTLVVVCGVVVDAHDIAKRSGLDPDEAQIPLGDFSVPLLGLSCAVIAASLARFIAQIKLSTEIILSFFYYSWRNSIYGKTQPIFPSLFLSLETKSGSRLFILYQELADMGA